MKKSLISGLLLLLFIFTSCKLPNSVELVKPVEPPVYEEDYRKIVSYTPTLVDNFGSSVAISGEYAVVGASYDDTKAQNSGTAYVYFRGINKTWENVTQLTANDNNPANIQFGKSVAIDGDYIVVGTDLAKGNVDRSGAAYVFRRTGENTWDNGFKIVASDGKVNDSFAYSVAISGNQIIVGAMDVDGIGEDSGAIYIFERTGLNFWSNETKITASDGKANEWFGKSVGISGNYVVSGAPGQFDAGMVKGAAYVYSKSQTTGIWGDEKKLRSTEVNGLAQLGESVGISGDYVVLGAWKLNPPGSTSGGAVRGTAFIHKRLSTNEWDGGVMIKAKDGASGDEFGHAVSISGDSVLVGSRGDADFGAKSGSAYLFKNTGNNSWDEGIKILSPEEKAEEQFGYSVALSSNHSLIGAPMPSQIDRGSYAYIIKK